MRSLQQAGFCEIQAIMMQGTWLSIILPFLVSVAKGHAEVAGAVR